MRCILTLICAVGFLVGCGGGEPAEYAEAAPAAQPTLIQVEEPEPPYRLA